MKRSELVKAAKELNEVLGLEPEIDIKEKPKRLVESIKEAAGLVDPELDDLSDDTLSVIAEIEEKKEKGGKSEGGKFEKEEFEKSGDSVKIVEKGESRKGRKLKKTRAFVMAEILKSTERKPLTKGEMINEMKMRYGGSRAEASLQVNKYMRLLLELGLLEEGERGKYTYNGK